MPQSAKLAGRIRPVRFSMRTGLILVLFLGAGLGMGARFWREVHERGEAQKSLFAKPTNSTGMPLTTSTVTYATEGEQSWFVKVVRSLVHPEYERKLSSISIEGSGHGDPTATNVSKVYGVEALELGGEFSEDWVAKAISAQGLRSLTLSGLVTGHSNSLSIDRLPPPTELSMLQINATTALRPEFVYWLFRSPKLNRVTCGGTDFRILSLARGHSGVSTLQSGEFTVRMNQARYIEPLALEADPILASRWPTALAVLLEAIRQREDIKCLRLESARIADRESMKEFCERSKIESLGLKECDISRECLRELVNLRSLKSLHLDFTPLDAEDLQVLATMTSLQEIRSLWCGDDEAENELQKALPNCKITIKSHGSRGQEIEL